MKAKIAYLIDESCAFEDEHWVFYEEEDYPEYKTRFKRIVYFEVL